MFEQEAKKYASDLELIYKKGVLDGIAEGRKENTKLEKENAELKELLKTFLLIADKKVSQMDFQLCVADAKQFLNMVVEK